MLRTAAVAIAIAALIDPAVAVSGRARPRIAVVIERPSPEGDRVRRTLTSDLQPDFDVVARFDRSATETVVIGGRYPERMLSDAQRVSTVTLAPPGSPNVRIVRILAPPATPVGNAIHVEAEVEATGMAGSTSEVAVRLAGVEAGRATHAWTRDRERWRAALDLVPVGSPPFVLHVEAAPLSAERSRADNAADVLVQSDARRLRVLVYEPRPSWASTFVRRALEDDPRFTVTSVSFASRGIASATAGVRASHVLDDDLDRFDAVVVGGLERLAAADVRALDRFMRERGGSVVLLPDARVDAGPVRELMPAGVLSEVLLEKPASLEAPAPLPRLDASEILAARDAGADADVFARVSGSNDAVVFASPRGDGRVLFSGALDAWRFRGDERARFDRFWRSAIAGLAIASPEPVRVELTPPLLVPGETARITVRIRRSELDRATGNPPAVSASVDDTDAVRLWPEVERGVFSGTLTASGAPGRHHVAIMTHGAHAITVATAFVVDPNAKLLVDAEGAPALSMLSASHDGVDVSPDRLDLLEQHLRRETPARTRTSWHPMRSGWWIVPFAGCLAAEWGIRRRRGLR